MSAVNQPAVASPPKFDRWAARLFAILLIVVGLSALVLLANSGDLPPGAILVLMGGVPLGSVVLVVAMQGLGRGSPWARPLAVALLWILVIAGVLRFLSSLGTGLNFPLEAIAAAFVLRVRRGEEPRPVTSIRDDVMILVLAGLYVVASAWPAVASAALRPGASLFAVDQQSLDVRVDVDCSQATSDRGIEATVNWAWRNRDVLPGSTDGLVVRWSGAGTDPAPSLDLEASSLPPELWSGGGSPAMTLTQPIEQASTYGQVETFGIDVRRFGQTDGAVHLVLRPDPERAHGTIDVVAVYAHLDRWTKWSDNRLCEW